VAATSVAVMAGGAAAETFDADASGDPGDAEEAEATPWRRGRGATAVGRAVHATLQLVDLATGAGLAELARTQAMAEGIPGRSADVAALVDVALRSDVIRAAVAGGRYWKELYVGAPVGARVLEGFVDLLVERPDGLEVVDYKTDSAPEDDLDRVLDHYRVQGASYAVAVERALGRPVTRCTFLFLRRDKAVERRITDLVAAKAHVEEILRS
jgi:hypothetical protein